MGRGLFLDCGGVTTSFCGEEAVGGVWATSGFP